MGFVTTPNQGDEAEKVEVQTEHQKIRKSLAFPKTDKPRRYACTVMLEVELEIICA